MAMSVRALRPGPIEQWDVYPLTIAAAKVARLCSVPGPFRIRTFQQNLGYIQIYPDISVGIFSPSNVRAKRKTLLESPAHAQVLRGNTDEHEMLLRAGGRCFQNGALSESLFRSPWSVPTTGSCATANQAWQRATRSASVHPRPRPLALGDSLSPAAMASAVAAAAEKEGGPPPSTPPTAAAALPPCPAPPGSAGGAPPPLSTPLPPPRPPSAAAAPAVLPDQLP